MSNNSYFCFIMHVVWSTKNRQDLIRPEFKEILYSAIGKLMNQKNWHLIVIGGTSNHIHMLYFQPSNILVSELICKIKAFSSKYIRDNFIENFAWQNGYGAFSVDRISLERLKNYIKNQEIHHKNIDYKKEFELILNRYNVSFKAEFLFD